jgi:hypothetical protein
MREVPAPDAAQRVALREAVRCRAGAPVTWASKKPAPGFCGAALKKRCIAPGTRTLLRELPHHLDQIGFFLENRCPASTGTPRFQLPFNNLWDNLNEYF